MAAAAARSVPALLESLAHEVTAEAREGMMGIVG